MPALIFDFDSTLIVDESLEMLLKYSLEEQREKEGGDGTGLTQEDIDRKMAEIANITNRGMNGEITMTESYNARLAIAKPTPRSLEVYLKEVKDKVTPGLREVIDEFRQRYPQVEVHILSLGPLACILPVAESLNIPAHCCHAVDLNINGNPYIKDNERLLLPRGKSNMLRSLREGSNDGTTTTTTTTMSTTGPFVVVGDGVTDMQTKEDGVAEVAIGFGINKQREKVKAMCDHFVTEMCEFRRVLFETFDELLLLRTAAAAAATN